MNQIFRITVGQETIQGRLPSVRVGKDYCCRFHIYGVDYSETVLPPKIWVSTGTGTLFWTGVWSETVGAWVVDVNTDATATVGAKSYALTVFSPDAADKEYLVGQAAFVVFTTIAGGGETGGTAGESVFVRLAALEAWMDNFADLPMFDPESAFDIDMRTQIQTITNRLRGAE